MPDEFEPIIDTTLARAAQQFDPSQGWAAAQRGEADFSVLAQNLGIATRQRTDQRTAIARPPVVSVRQPPHRVRTWIGYGAVVAVAALFIAILGRRANDRTPQFASVTGQSYVTHRGEQLTKQLPDGSRITLAPESRAKFVMRGEARVVELEGQAFFDIRNSVSTPFIVESPGVTTRVLGTSFVVRSYADRPTSQVAVVTGKVGVTPDGQPESVVTAGYMSTILDGRVTSAQIKTVDPDVLSWLDGGLIFNGTSLDDVTIELERRFDVKITIRDSSLRMRRFTMEFANPSLIEVLDVLAPTIGARYEQRGNHITLLAR